MTRKLQDSEVIEFFYKYFPEYKNFSMGKEVQIPGLGVLVPKDEYKRKVKEVIKAIKGKKKIHLTKKFRVISLSKLKKVVILTNRENLPKINIIKKQKRRKVMSTKVPESSGIELLENGSYAAVCYGIAIIGTVKEMFKNQEKTLKKIRVFWELPGETFTFTKDNVEKTVTYTISQKFTLSSSSNSNLLKMLKPWSDNKINKDNIAGFDMAGMVGKKGLISVEQKPSTKGDRTYLNFAGILALPKGMVVEKPTQEFFVFDVEEFDEEKFRKLPSWVMKEVAESKEFIAQKRDINDYLNEAADEQPAVSSGSEDSDAW